MNYIVILTLICAVLSSGQLAWGAKNMTRTKAPPTPLNRNLINKMSQLGHDTTKKSNVLRQTGGSYNMVDLEAIDNFDNYINSRSGKSGESGRVDLAKLNEMLDKKSQQELRASLDKNKQRSSSKSTRGTDQLANIYRGLLNGEHVLGDESINTVRYIPSTKVITDQKIYFIFNMSLLSTSEQLVKVELSIHKRFVNQRLAFNLNYFLYSTSNKSESKQSNEFDQPSANIDLANKRMPRHHHWAHFNIIDSLSSYTSVRNERFDRLNQEALRMTGKQQTRPDELIFILETEKSSRLSKMKLQDSINPFIMVYTNENQETMKNFFQTRIPSELVSGEVVESPEYDMDQEDENLDTTIMHTTTTASTTTIKQTQYDYFMSNKDKSVILIEEKAKPNIDHVKAKLKEASKLMNGTEEKLNKIYESSLMSFFNGKRKRDLNAMNENETDSPLLLSENLANYHDTKQAGCEMKPVIIDFSDLSFNEWIIEPKSFQTNYCAGECDFKSNKKMSFSNHATLQSILGMLNINQGGKAMSSLCCSASKADSLPVMYTDVNQVDKVVKLLPDMVVTECSCR